MARQRPTASADEQTRLPRTTDSALTRAEARALSRSAPLTAAEFKARRHLAEQSVDPLSTLLTGEMPAHDRRGRGSASG